MQRPDEKKDDEKIAVLIDADNTSGKKLKLILEEISAKGQVVVKRAYGDFSNESLKNWQIPLNELAIDPIRQKLNRYIDDHRGHGFAL